MSVSTKTLKIHDENHEIIFKEGENLLDILNDNKVSINQSCGGNGSCTTCRVFVHSDEHCFSPRSEIELERAEERAFQSNERLACQTYLLDSAEIEIPADEI